MLEDLPAFASLAELAARIPGGIADSDQTRAQAALDDASSLIRAEAGATWVDDEDELVDDLPDIVIVVTLKAAQRCLDNPDTVTQEAIGTYSYSLANASTDVYLTTNERRLVRRAAGRGGVSVLRTTRGDVPDVDSLTCLVGETTYVPVDPAGQGLPVDWP